jgi:hypothetical protein
MRAQSSIWQLIQVVKGVCTSVDVLHLYDSFRQKCSKLGTYTTQDLKYNFYFRGFSIISGPELRISDEYHQVFRFFNKVLWRIKMKMRR